MRNHLSAFLEPTKQTEKDRPDERERDRQKEEKAEQRDDYVAHRVREIEAFERRARGTGQASRRKRE